MEKNKTAKYFKYAIGEIILVVIGILIALSINNWNEGHLHHPFISATSFTLEEDLKMDVVGNNTDFKG